MADEPKVLSIDEILGADDIQYTEVPTPEWGGVVRLGSLNADDMMTFIEASEGPAKTNAGLRLIIASLVDDKGVRIGSEKHLSLLKKKDARVINRLVQEVLKLNGMETKTQAAEKNGSGEAGTAASPSV